MEENPQCHKPTFFFMSGVVPSSLLLLVSESVSLFLTANWQAVVLPVMLEAGPMVFSVFLFVFHS